MGGAEEDEDGEQKEQKDEGDEERLLFLTVTCLINVSQATKAL